MMNSKWVKTLVGLAGLNVISAVAALAGATLKLQAERHSPLDLAITGLVAGVDGTAYLAAEDLAALPTTHLIINGGLDGVGDKKQDLTVVWLDDLWAALPVEAGADTMLARCKDGYFSVYEQQKFATQKPFLVLAINGKGRADWPPPGMRYNPGPNVILVSAQVAPAVANLLDAGHKNPWGVTSLEIAKYTGTFASAYAGKWEDLSATAERGRGIWINSCASCHAGPQGMAGGTKSARPFEVVAAQAHYNQAYFELYVRDPKAAMPGATMEAHPHYTDDEMAALIAFITADGKS